jgi:hypothetical protein
MEIKIGNEFWFDGKFWIKTSSDTAESQTTVRKFEDNEVVN